MPNNRTGNGRNNNDGKAQGYDQFSSTWDKHNRIRNSTIAKMMQKTTFFQKPNIPKILEDHLMQIARVLDNTIIKELVKNLGDDEIHNDSIQPIIRDNTNRKQITKNFVNEQSTKSFVNEQNINVERLKQLEKKFYLNTFDKLYDKKINKIKPNLILLIQKSIEKAINTATNLNWPQDIQRRMNTIGQTSKTKEDINELLKLKKEIIQIGNNHIQKLTPTTQSKNSRRVTRTQRPTQTKTKRVTKVVKVTQNKPKTTKTTKQNRIIRQGRNGGLYVLCYKTNPWTNTRTAYKKYL